MILVFFLQLRSHLSPFFTSTRTCLKMLGRDYGVSLLPPMPSGQSAGGSPALLHMPSHKKPSICFEQMNFYPSLSNVPHISADEGRRRVCKLPVYSPPFCFDFRAAVLRCV